MTLQPFPTDMQIVSWGEPTDDGEIFSAIHNGVLHIAGSPRALRAAISQTAWTPLLPSAARVEWKIAA